MGLIDYLEDIIDKSKPTMLSNKVAVNKEQLIEIIEEIRLKIPAEVQQSMWVRDERNKILADAQNEAHIIIEEAHERLQDLIDQHEITRQAKEQAQVIRENANRDSREIRLGAMEYAEEVFKDIEQKLKAVLDNVHREVNEFEMQLTDTLARIYDHRQEIKGIINNSSQIDEEWEKITLDKL